MKLGRTGSYTVGCFIARFPFRYKQQSTIINIYKQKCHSYFTGYFNVWDGATSFELCANYIHILSSVKLAGGDSKQSTVRHTLLGRHRAEQYFLRSFTKYEHSYALNVWCRLTALRRQLSEQSHVTIAVWVAQNNFVAFSARTARWSSVASTCATFFIISYLHFTNTVRNTCVLVELPVTTPLNTQAECFPWNINWISTVIRINFRPWWSKGTNARKECW